MMKEEISNSIVCMKYEGMNLPFELLCHTFSEERH